MDGIPFAKHVQVYTMQYKDLFHRSISFQFANIQSVFARDIDHTLSSRRNVSNDITDMQKMKPVRQQSLQFIKTRYRKIKIESIDYNAAIGTIAGPEKAHYNTTCGTALNIVGCPLITAGQCKAVAAVKEGL